MTKITSGFVSASLVLWLALSTFGCQSGPLPVPPPPQASNLAPAAQATPVPSPTVGTIAPSVTPTVSLMASSLVKEAAMRVDSNIATISFPDKITFALKGINPLIIKTIALEYGTDEHSLSNQTIRTEIDFPESSTVSASWEWQMKKTGSLPPGATVWWQWVLTDVNGKSVTVPRDTLNYTDTRFTWQVSKLADMDVYWYGQNEPLVNQLTTELESRLARIELKVTIPPERKPEIYVYTSSEDIKSAILNSQDWIGAMAFPNYNIVMTAVNTGNLEWAKGALPHEIAHLMVGEAIFGPFGDIPTWLNEGLAEQTESSISDYLQEALNEAIKGNKLISVRSLAGSFPTDAAGANLAYAESSSLVGYMIDTYGWEKMRSLLAVFKDGATYDKGLQTVYNLDVNGLEAEWRAALKTK